MTELDYTLIERHCEYIRKRLLEEERHGDFQPADTDSGLPEALVKIYLDLTREVGQPPTPDMLLRLGKPGMVVHVVTCRTAGLWRAFRSAVARRSPEAVYPTPSTEGAIRLSSQQEKLVYRQLCRLPGVTSVEPHPRLRPGSAMLGDFRVAASTGRFEYVEVTMVVSNPAADSSFYRAYRARLQRKLDCYGELGHRPVLVWADDLAPPRRLVARINELADRLGLDPLPPPAPMWFEPGTQGAAA